AVCAVSSNVIVVLSSGTPVDMRGWLDGTEALLQAWYPGMEGGHAIASVLCGDSDPCGRLPASFPQSLEQHSSHGHYPGKDGKVAFGEGLFIGYRHYDRSGDRPQFCFGHGLSYTKFLFRDLSLEQKPGNLVRVSLFVENQGERTGKEVVQIYVRAIGSAVTRPEKELKAFAKLELGAGESRQVHIDLDSKAFAHYSVEGGGWRVDDGEYEIIAGHSSQNLPLRKILHLKGL
ncbi:MAG: glycoside hydrolase family 3 C-terminal domain-containing protein, partial [Planctomycetes bacterium]|nr:glycoside hydrolase family 3 C-terminal domain-containing protein [Planctomycetota bacterium]